MLHPERRRRREILHAIVDEQRASRISLRDAKHALVNLVHRLPGAQPARRKETREDVAQSEGLDAVDVQLLALVVERRHADEPAVGELPRDGDAVRPRDALLEHECLEVGARHAGVAAVGGDPQILVERHLANLERPDRFLVTILKILGVEAKALDRGVALLSVPSVAAEHAADVEQHELDRRRSSDEHRARRCAIEAGDPQRKTAKIVRSHRRHRQVEPFDDDDAALEQRPMRPVMARMKLLDRQVVDADEPNAERHEILGAVGREIGVVGVKVLLADERRIARLDQARASAP